MKRKGLHNINSIKSSIIMYFIKIFAFGALLGSQVMGFKSKLLSMRFQLINKIVCLGSKHSVFWIPLTASRVAQRTCEGRNKM